VPDAAKQRILFLDWIRGFACLLMFQTHGYDSWLGGQARNTELFRLSQLGGTLPAPLFLFAAGISVALVMERMRQKGLASRQVARTTMVRGLQIFGFALLFRLQEFLLGQPYAPWTDLLRVDILNVIGLSIVLMGLLLWIVAPAQDRPAGAADTRVVRFPLRAKLVSMSIASAAAIALATPPLWTTHRLRWLPWYVQTYLNGVHTFDQPQPWLFPIFPWAAFAFAGLAFGFLLFSPQARRHESAAFALSAVAGALLLFLGRWLDSRTSQLYAVYDFWHTSPNFFLMRTGILLGIVFVSYAWCRWGAERGFSPVVELGRSSLVVYWVHTEFVYGRFSILAKQGQTIPAATLGILVICAAMVALATLRNRLKGRGPGVLAFWRRPARIPA